MAWIALRLAKLACEPDVSVARLAMELGVNPNLVFKWRRALRAGEYDSVDLLPVTVEAPAQEIEQPAPAPVASAAPAGTIEISVGNTRVRIEGSPPWSYSSLNRWKLSRKYPG
ncbi:MULTISPECIES: transposase [Burkholderia cepacia complex]|uniref:transposase n=1 Tax=Burkholderia cepacia complex TaxID=87882 RepID=UPI00299DA7F9|nr:MULTISPECIES: transposase [Burkholderia cepacia complex]